MSKNLILFVTAVIFAFICITTTELSAYYVCGDANSDMTVNVSDAVWIINYIFAGGDPPDPLEAGDANCDRTCNIADAVWIINYIFAGGYEPCTVVDIDGNVYQTIRIGNQCWMAENLKVTHYCNGDPIPNVTDNSEWEGLSTGAYCNYDNDEGNVAVYGRLYNWYAVDDSRDLAPAGWHVPSDAEWKQLEMYLGMSQAEADANGWRGTDEGGKLKETGTTHWFAPNTGATNESGFTALPGGHRNYLGISLHMGINGYFWCTTEISSDLALGRGLDYDNSQIGRFQYYEHDGFSVRCVKD